MLNINVTIFYCIFKIVTCFHEKDHVCDTHLPDDKMMITTEVNEWFFTKKYFLERQQAPLHQIYLSFG
jgi:hypothetical protein